jgi:hypothetical protein
MIVITLGKTHTMDFVITIHGHVPVTAVTPLYMIRCITGIASCQFLEHYTPIGFIVHDTRIKDNILII